MITPDPAGPIQVYRVQIPPEIGPGQEFHVVAGHRTVRVICPAESRGGHYLQITVPASDPVMRREALGMAVLLVEQNANLALEVSHYGYVLETGDLALEGLRDHPSQTLFSLAEDAGVNVASISYYFGDKAGLYRAVFFEPLGSPQDDIARYNGVELSLTQALAGFFAGFLEPLNAPPTRRGREAHLGGNLAHLLLGIALQDVENPAINSI